MDSGVLSISRDGLAGRLLSWWLGELRALLPAGLRRGLGLQRATLIAEPGGDGIRLARFDGSHRRDLGTLTAGKAAAAELRGEAVRVRLAGEQGLAKTLTLPIAAEENLREVLAFEMERQTPFPADQVYFDYRVIERRPLDKVLTARLVVAPRERVERAVEDLRAVGLPVHAVDLASEPLDFDACNLLPEELRAPLPRQRGVGALAAAAAVLAVIAALSPLAHGWFAKRQADAEIALLRLQADSALKLRAALDAELGSYSTIAADRDRRPRAVLVLEELTRIFPDTAWVSEFALVGSELEIAGTAGSAAGLVQQIEASKIFKAVDFRTAVARDPTSGQERFQFEIDLAPPGGKP